MTSQDIVVGERSAESQRLRVVIQHFLGVRKRGGGRVAKKRKG